MPTRRPTVSFNGTIRYDSPHETSTTVMSLALEGLEGADVHHETLAPGVQDVTVTPANPARGVIIQAPREIRINLNGGTTDIPVDGLFILVSTDGGITEVTLHNDLLDPAARVEVDIRFYIGGEVV